MEYVVIGLTCLALLIGFLLYEGLMAKKYNIEKAKKINSCFGKKQNREYKLEELQGIKDFFYKFKEENSVDDITANDLDIDKIYMAYNFSASSAGDDYLYYRLRTPRQDVLKISADEAKIEFVANNKEERFNLLKYFIGIGKMRRISFVDFIEILEEAEVPSVFADYLCILFVILSAGLIFINAPLGIAALVATFAYNIISYYKKRGDFETYTIGCAFIISFISNAKELNSLKNTPIEEDVSLIQGKCKKLSGLSRSFSFISSSYKQTGAGNPLDIFVDYLKMTLHIDIIKFHSLLKGLKENIDEIKELYLLTGKLESYISIASMREALPGYSIPVMDDSIIGLETVNVYHPLLNEPVKNDISTSKSVLITGSNASGKSTFLKAIAINMLMAETINTVAADLFKSPRYTVFSSMSLRDDITKGDSYFMAEIKSFKRIVDYISKHKDEKVIAFTDELLRGTNTIERIASCNSILMNLSDNNALVFSATHDIELTELLSSKYDNYHFDEEFVDGDVLFNYKIKEGKATSKNAIRLLNVMGFDDKVVEQAQSIADKFINEGVWSNY